MYILQSSIFHTLEEKVMRVILDNAGGGEQVSLSRKALLRADLWVRCLSKVPDETVELFVNHADALHTEIREWRKAHPNVRVFVYHPHSSQYGIRGVFDAGLNLQHVQNGQDPLKHLWVTDRLEWPQNEAFLAQMEALRLETVATDLEARAAKLRQEAAAIRAQIQK